MKTVGDWNHGLDEVEKIGWPFHGLLQQESPTLCTLTAPGAVLQFPIGDTSHAISYPVSLTDTNSWRTGKCQRFQIPGIPMPTTTAEEVAAGMTWLNYFIESGIAHFGLGFRILVDEDNKPWRYAVRESGYAPTAIDIYGHTNGVFGVKRSVPIVGPAWDQAISIVSKRGLTCSSNGRKVVINYFGSAPSSLETDIPLRTALITITGSFDADTLQATCEKLVDLGVPGLTGSEGGDIFTYTGTWSQSMDWKLQKSTWGTYGWGPFVDEGQTTTMSNSGSFGPRTDMSVMEYDPPANTPETPPKTAEFLYRWVSLAQTYDSIRSGEYIANFSMFQCLGYFIGHDDSLVRVDRRYARVTQGTESRSSGSADVTTHGTITYSDYVTVGLRESERVSDYDEFAGVNVTTFTRFAGPRGKVVNTLADGHRAVCLATPTANETIFRWSKVCGQVEDKALYDSSFSFGTGLVTAPHFSVHPINGQIATRPGDGYPISWV